MYCICIWGNSPFVYLKPLVMLQKRAVRVIAGAKYLAHTSPIFKELKILNMNNIYVYNLLLIMYKHHHNKLPAIFDPFFVRFNELHSYGTRHSDHLRAPEQTNARSTHSVRSRGYKIYNYFVTRLDFNVEISSFKRQAKSYLLDNDISFLLKEDDA